MANTPAQMSDTGIHALFELEHEQVYLRSVPAQDWRLDLTEDGIVVGTCPCCAYRGALLHTRDERIQCCECSHVDGEQTVRVGASSESPGELESVPYRDPDDCDQLFEEDDHA